MPDKCPECGAEIRYLPHDPDPLGIGGLIPECNATIAAQAEEIERLQTIEALLPKTADGVIIRPGSRVFYRCAAVEARTVGTLVSLMRWTHHPKEGIAWDLWSDDIDDSYGRPGAIPDDIPLYSSREALERGEH